MRAWVLALLCALALTGTGAAYADAPARVTSVRFGGESDRTRVVVESDRPLRYHLFLLAAGTQRVVIDLPKVRWSINGLTAESGAGKGDGVVGGFRYAHNTATTSRLVLDLATPALVAREFVLSPKTEGDPYRIVLDLEATSLTQFAESAEGARSRPPPVAQQTARRPLIVIDPGHGGKDPGASSQKGLQEKEVTLGIAAALREELMKSKRYDVAMTRSTDVFIELEDRVARARDLGADLFISLHADAGPKAETRGASVYTLSPEGEKRVEAARHKNDWILDVEIDADRPQEVTQILADLVQRETKNQSARFAQTLVPALAEAGWPALQNTHRKRGFYVLLSPDVPAVLLEMGFITNAQDAAMLVSETKRKKLVEGIAHAIDSFFETQTQMLAAR
ncbi:MAG TPA: N-acetylmuramoyl-L-alanine amidase [Hyphomonadaceae bacterium]|nr:N-acetylmuramoyl-L-alanine amidase [Hyphomonadaceae bacterium]